MSQPNANVNTSATGGYLSPATQTKDGLDLRRFLQTVIVGVTLLPVDLVRPMWQIDPPPIPGIEVDWCGYAILEQRSEAGLPYIVALNPIATRFIRHEEIDILCAFYGQDALTKAAIFRDDLELGQNREQLFLADIGLVGCSGIRHIPELINDRYIDRADITWTIRREIRREYPILQFASAVGNVSGQASGGAREQSVTVVDEEG